MSNIGTIDPIHGLTDLQLDALESLASRATPGTWSPVLGVDGWRVGLIRQHQARPLVRREDAELSAALSPDVVRALVNEIRTARR